MEFWYHGQVTLHSEAKKLHRWKKGEIFLRYLCHPENLFFVFFSLGKSGGETGCSCQRDEDFMLTGRWTSLQFGGWTVQFQLELCSLRTVCVSRFGEWGRVRSQGPSRAPQARASRGASGRGAGRVRLSEEGAHQRPLHGWDAVGCWQLVIYHSWAAVSGGRVINFTLPLSEISPINHLKLLAPDSVVAAWQIFTASCTAQRSLACGSGKRWRKKNRNK